MSERKGTKGLELWCKKMTEGYPGVKVENMTTSWRDGLAFCAIIHHFRPDLIDFAKLNKDDIYHNNELAFRTAEHHLGIPALLEPEDMVEYDVPDRLSILTYLSQFYQAFASSQGVSNRIPTKRPQTSSEHDIVSATSSSPPNKVASFSVGRLKREPCAKCRLPVFLAERLNIGKLLFHRTCFRCARCNSQLTLASYYETENEEFCCEVCPDEEKHISKASKEKALLQKSMSDEEKTANLRLISGHPDDYSELFETALESITNSGKSSNDFSDARVNFFRSQINSDAPDEEEQQPQLPNSHPSELEKFNQFLTDDAVDSVSGDSGFPDTKLSEMYTNDKVSIGKTSHDIVTKDNKGEERSVISLVKARAQLFESNIQDIIKSDLQENIQDIHKISKIPDKSTIPVIKLDELEDFDDSFTKKSIDNRSKEVFCTSTSMDSIADNVSSENAQMENKNNEETHDDYQEKSHIHDIAIKPHNGEHKKLVQKIEDESKQETFQIEKLISKHLPLENENNKKNIQDEITPTDITTSSSNSQTNCSASETVRSTPTVSIPSEDNPLLTENKSKDSKDYPSHLNPFDEGDSDEGENETGNKSLNPFDSDDEEEKEENISSEIKPLPTPRVKKGFVSKKPVDKQNLNPFGSDEENEEPLKPLPTPRTMKKIVPASSDETSLTSESRSNVQEIVHKTTGKESSNPFSSDEEDQQQSLSPQVKPLPTPRMRRKILPNPQDKILPDTSRNTEDRSDDEFSDDHPAPKPRTSIGTRSEYGSEDYGYLNSNFRHTFGSSSSISSSSAPGSARKKKPAPRPPIPNFINNSGSNTHTPSSSRNHSPKLTPKYKKNRIAPPPPTVKTSTPLDYRNMQVNTDDNISPIKLDSPKDKSRYDDKKYAKDKVNRNRQTKDTHIQNPTSSESSSTTPNKSTYGPWKRRKGQAPKRPIPQRRVIKVIPMSEIRKELDIIEIQQQGLEKQGVKIEQIIREKCEGKPNGGTDSPEDDTPIEVEDLILQLFEIVNEKNELFRKQTELMYLKRQHRLEEEHADVEYQIRCLMLKPEENKTDSDKAKEEDLIKRLVEIVERRNEIIDCLENDRRRENDEDKSINNHITLYSLKREECKAESPKPEKQKQKSKKDKYYKKEKNKLKDKKNIDSDKDEDETEISLTKGKKKKKFSLF